MTAKQEKAFKELGDLCIVTFGKDTISVKTRAGVGREKIGRVTLDDQKAKAKAFVKKMVDAKAEYIGNKQGAGKKVTNAFMFKLSKGWKA